MADLTGTRRTGLLRPAASRLVARKMLGASAGENPTEAHVRRLPPSVRAQCSNASNNAADQLKPREFIAAPSVGL
ncbi:hypothetical protein GCM10009838_24220 [Catenulispora subtropica]|uniref:Uncharacterized protein n=1 Tax=Catenulispora subtropica TaxID=450798 RepID=A0ABP5CLL3_9ACTN